MGRGRAPSSGGGAVSASASYWAHAFDDRNQTREWMWNCEACPAVGLETSEAEVVRAMNAHMADAHPDEGYVAPPVPE